MFLSRRTGIVGEKLSNLKTSPFLDDFWSGISYSFTCYSEYWHVANRPVKYNGVDIIPIQFLKAVLPDPGDLAKTIPAETSIGCRIKGIKDGKEQTYYVTTIAVTRLHLRKPEHRAFHTLQACLP
jgi:saccharopine dehydrogenase-like NADP-dependent oxidoreductase